MLHFHLMWSYNSREKNSKCCVDLWVKLSHAWKTLLSVIVFFASELPSEIEAAKMKIEAAKTWVMGGKLRQFSIFRLVRWRNWDIFWRLRWIWCCRRDAKEESQLLKNVFFVSESVILHCNFKKSPAGAILNEHKCSMFNNHLVFFNC